MLEPFFFSIGVANSILLILIFLARRSHVETLRRYGWVYLLLAIPALVAILLALHEEKPIQYTVFLAIFLSFLTVELVYDFALKVDFRLNWLRNWRWTAPYLALYWAMNYGFVVMVWKISLTGGLVMLGLFIVQIVANVATHPRIKGRAAERQ
jgi:hypothetical protein